jgi:hypothetical protein
MESRSNSDREGACKSMNHAQKYLAQANRQIAELMVQIARQRVIVKQALDTGRGSEMAESLLDALEGSLRLFEKHPLILGQLPRQPSEQRVVRAPRPATGTGRAGTWHNQCLIMTIGQRRTCRLVRFI